MLEKNRIQTIHKLIYNIYYDNKLSRSTGSGLVVIAER